MTRLIGSSFLIFFLFLSNNIYALSDSPHNIPDKLTINIKGKPFKTYLNYLLKIAKTPGNQIYEEYKKKFKISGSYFDEGGSKIFMTGKARITGDWKDHIGGFGDIGLSSLSISLKKSNIGGITNFRILLPKTRENLNEIFWSSLMEEIGLPVPIRKIVLVKINGVEHEYIFEEKPEKEFLESIGIREAPIIEYDERQVWANRENNPNNIKIFQNASIAQYKIKNKDFIKNDLSELISLKAISSLQPKNKIISYYDKINKKYASHGLIYHNRKYIYSPIYNDYLPIYFDGMVFISDKTKKEIKKKCDNFNIAMLNNSLRKKINVLNAKFLDRTLKKTKLDKIKKCVAADIFKSSENVSLHLQNINLIQSNSLDQKQNIYNLLESVNVNNGYPDIVEIKPSRKSINRLRFNYENKSWEKIEEIEYKKIKKILSGDDKPKRIKKFKLYDVVNFSNPINYEETFDAIEATNNELTIDVKENETKYIKLSASDSIIKINLKNSKSKIVFYQSKIKKSKVFIGSNLEKMNEINGNLIRYDSRLLTSCATIIDSELYDTLISSNNCQLEDGLNFVRSNGSNISIKINNALFDGLDADFSTLTFNEISIQNSGNDCIDVSAGTYNFKKINADRCGDKAISIGEKSLVAINKAYLNNANIGLAVKDLSEVSLHSIKQNNLKECINVYQKKQEFGPGTIILNKNINDCEVNLKNGSILVRGNSCMKVEKNYFYNSCIKNGSIQVAIKKPLPSSSLFYLNVRDDKTKKINDLNLLIQESYKASCKVNESCDFEVKIENQYVNMGLYDNDLGKYSLKEFH
jgi:hypothetical protein